MNTAKKKVKKSKRGIAYSKEERDRAFDLYCEYKSHREIMDELGIGSQGTTHKWKKKYKWDEKRGKREDTTEKTIAKTASNDIANKIKAQTNLASAIRGLVAAKVNEYQKKAQKAIDAGLPPDLPSETIIGRIAAAARTAIELERLVLGMSTENIDHTVKVPDIHVIEADVRKMLEGTPEIDVTEMIVEGKKELKRAN